MFSPILQLAWPQETRDLEIISKYFEYSEK